MITQFNLLRGPEQLGIQLVLHAYVSV